MKYVRGNYIDRDIKRLNVIRSLEEDIENHYKVFRGKVIEIKSPYSVPLVEAFLYETELGGYTVYFFKDYWGTKNPFQTSRDGLRIIFAVFKDKEKNILLQYTPIIVFLAKEEKNSYFCPNGKKYPLQKSGFRNIIQSKLEYL